MSKKQPTTPLERTALTAKDVREVARQLAYFTSLYDGAADEMDKSGLKELEVKGATNLYLSLERMNGSVQSLQSSLSKARTAKLKKSKQDITQQEATAKADAAASTSQQTQPPKGATKKRSKP